MGLWSSICDGVSSLCSWASSAVSTAVSAIAPMIEKLGGALAVVFPQIALVCKVIGVILNLLSPEQDMPELGDKVLQAQEAGITLQSCNNDFEEYKKQIEGFEVDTEKSKKYNELDKNIAAIYYVTEGIAHKQPSLQFEAMLPVIAAMPSFFTPERMESYTKTALATGYSLAKLADYIKGSCSVTDDPKNEEFWRTAEREFDPNMDEKDFKKNMNSVKIAVRK